MNDVQEINKSFSLPFTEATIFNKWLFDRVRHYLKGVVFELGSGTGDLSSIFVEHSVPIILTDPSKPNRDKLRERFRGNPTLRYIDNIDFNCSDFQATYSSIIGTVDTMMALNIADNGFFTDRALLNAKQLARERGHIALITPFKTAGYLGLNEDLEKLKRYNYKQLNELLHDCEVIKSFYFTVSEAITASGSFGHAFLIVARKRKLSNL